MKSLLRLAARLYPRQWRGRYGDEFEALLDDVEPTWHQFRSILWGALSMQLSSANTYFRFAAIAALAGLIVSLAASFVQAPRYVSSAEVRVTTHGSEEYAAQRLGAITLSVASRPGLVDLILDPTLNLYLEERRHLPMEIVVEHMRQDLRISAVSSHSPQESRTVPALRVSFTHTDKNKAQAVVAKLVDRINQTNATINRFQELLWRDILKLPPRTTLAEDDAVLIDPVDLATQPAARNRLRFTALGLAGGLLFGLIVASLRRHPRWTLVMASLALVGFAAGVAPSFLVAQPYTSTATLMLTQEVPERFAGRALSISLADTIHQLKQEVLSRENVQRIIQKPTLDLYPQERKKMPVNEIIDRMFARNLSIQVVKPYLGPPSAFTISFTYPDRYKARAVVREMIAQFENRHVLSMKDHTAEGSIARLVLEHRAGENLELLEPTTIPTSPTDRDRTLPVAGLLLGLLVGGLATAFRRPRPSTPALAAS